jgi:hypothetical protein
LTPQRRKALRCFSLWALPSRAVTAAIFGKHGLDLIASGEFASIGVLDALVDITNMV